MESTEGPNHGRAVLEFLLFLNDTLSRASNHFEDHTACSPESANIIRIIARHGSLKVKDIGQLMPGMDPSKLTRLIDGLETHSYITRTINPKDRRSFLIAPTTEGLHLLGLFTGELGHLAQSMLTPLTPTERLILVELFNKIQRNWDIPDPT
jgi:DNA-binding MarR family transcriptional regulator